MRRKFGGEGGSFDVTRSTNADSDQSQPPSHASTSPSLAATGCPSNASGSPHLQFPGSQDPDGASSRSQQEHTAKRAGDRLTVPLDVARRVDVTPTRVTEHHLAALDHPLCKSLRCLCPPQLMPSPESFDSSFDGRRFGSSGEGRMAARAGLHSEVLPGGAGGNFVPACAAYERIHVWRMNSLLHVTPSPLNAVDATSLNYVRP